MIIVPRGSLLLDEPPPTRPLLRRGIVDLLCHYTGVGGYDGTKLDWEYAKSVVDYGKVAGKPYEYNYLIGPGGTCFQQAGDHLAAHCKGYNPQSIGVLFMLGLGVPPTQAMIATFLELRRHLVATGALSAAHQVWPHYRFRATSCPGDKLAEAQGASWASPTGEGRLGNVIAPLRAPLDAQEDEMPIEINARVYDTRSGSGHTGAGQAFKADEEREIAVSMGGSMATLRITALPFGSSSGFVQVWDRNKASTDTAAVNWWDGVPDDGVVTVTIRDGGWVKVKTSAACDLVIDTQVVF